MTEPSPQPGEADDRALPLAPLAAWAASAALSSCSANGSEHEMRVGTEQTHRTIAVVVPAGDLAPWDLDTKHAVVGTDVSRVDGVAKVTGRAKYAYDMRLPGMLHAAMKRAPHASATVRSIDVRAAR